MVDPEAVELSPAVGLNPAAGLNLAVGALASLELVLNGASFVLLVWDWCKFGRSW